MKHGLRDLVRLAEAPQRDVAAIEGALGTGIEG
jgi:hypothetical protein